MSNTLLSPPENSQLLAILFSSKSKTFLATAEAFQSVFSPSSRFSALSAALLLLEDSKALLIPQRLATWYVIYNSWPADAASNPFISFLLRTSERATASDAEKAVCLQLLAQHEVQQLSGQNPSEYALNAASNAAILRLLTDGNVRQQIEQRYSCLRQRQPEEQQATSSTEPLPSSGQLPPGSVPWQRPLPALMPLLANELEWLYPDLHTGLVWDSSLGEDGSEASAARELAARALRGPLLPAQQQRVLAALDADPRLAHRLGIQPQQLPALVEHCPALASALLLRLLRPRPSGRVAELLGVLARSEMSLHGMEVVNRLAASVELPPEFVHLYITNCIRSCENTQDKYVQSRLVRLVCVFLQSLIRNRILAAADLLHELQAFCINFSRIREAAKLFRLLKQIESGGAVCLSPTGAPAAGTAAAGASFGAAHLLRSAEGGVEEEGPHDDVFGVGASAGDNSSSHVSAPGVGMGSETNATVPDTAEHGEHLAQSPGSGSIYLGMPPTRDLLAAALIPQPQQLLGEW